MLKIGPGTGEKLRYLTSGRVRWIGVEPNPFMEPYLREEANRLSMPIELHIGTAETLPIADNSVDAAIATLVLCCVNIQHQSLQPRGSWLRRIQNLPTPIWKRLRYGCNPNRETWVEIERAGFENVTYERIIAPTLILSPQIVGVAKKLPDKGDPPLSSWKVGETRVAAHAFACAIINICGPGCRFGPSPFDSLMEEHMKYKLINGDEKGWAKLSETGQQQAQGNTCSSRSSRAGSMWPVLSRTQRRQRPVSRYETAVGS